MNAAERETVVNSDDESDVVRIWTAQRRYITKLRKDDAFTETDSGFHEGTEWATFTIPADRWTPAGVKRQRRNMSEAQKAAAAERLRAHNQRVRSIDMHNVAGN